MLVTSVSKKSNVDQSELEKKVNLSKTYKVKELIISESRDQCPRYSETFI